jgi:hypothetical protein
VDGALAKMAFGDLVDQKTGRPKEITKKHHEMTDWRMSLR